MNKKQIFEAIISNLDIILVWLLLSPLFVFSYFFWFNQKFFDDHMMLLQFLPAISFGDILLAFFVLKFFGKKKTRK